MEANRILFFWTPLAYIETLFKNYFFCVQHKKITNVWNYVIIMTVFKFLGELPVVCSMKASVYPYSGRCILGLVAWF